jgi:predicted nucleic acid-binding Zn ribbon protein
MEKEKSTPFGDILKKVVSILGKKKLTEEMLEDAWVKAAGDDAAGHTKCVGLKRAVLIVNVDVSSWLYELTTKKRDILAKMQESLEGKKIKEIRLRIGDIKR